MKFLLIASLAAFSLSSFANMNAMKGKTLEEQKEVLNTKLDRRIESLQASKVCVNGAKDEKSVNDCMKEQKQAMEEMHEKMDKQKEETKSSDW